MGNYDGLGDESNVVSHVCTCEECEALTQEVGENEVDVRIRFPRRRRRRGDDDNDPKPLPSKRRLLVSLNLMPGATLKGHAVAFEADGVTPDPNAVYTWSTDNPAVATVSPVDGPDTVITGVAAGPVNATCTATDPDGNKVESLPFAFTVPDTSTDAKSVTVTFS